MRGGRHVVCNLHAHLVFVTKYRRGVFTNDGRSRPRTGLVDVCRAVPSA
ncbi:transposase [Sphaerisporangium sp. NPDC051017]